MSRIGPQVDQQQPCARLHARPHLAHQFEVVRHREDMGCICDDQRIMVGGQRIPENIALDNVDPRTLWHVREFLPRDGTRARQFK
jgi:hypothetical protein